MADYRSTLTGTQMDQALLDMAEHNSEAYAVGERNGIAVASDDVTYHNNARYYAQIASSQIVGDASSAVRWDTDQSEVLTDAQKAQARENINAASDSDVVKITSQTLTSAQQAQARANIAAGGSNPNLLDNGWFRVNQRSATSGSGTTGSYIADRWAVTYGSGGVTWSRTDDTITIASTSGTSHGDIAQRMEKALFDYLVGKTVTVSVMLENYSIISRTITFTIGATPTIGTDTDGNGIVFRAYQSSTYQDVQIWKYYSAGTFRAVKIELGSVSTLANDTPPDYGEELLKCMRYFQRIKASQTYCPIGTGLGASSSSCYVFVPLPVPLRAYPTIAVNTVAQFHIYGESGDKAISAMSVRGVSSNGVTLSTTATGVTTYGTYMLVTADSNAYFDLSAEP